MDQRRTEHALGIPGNLDRSAAARRKAFRRMLEICEREDPAYTVLHQNATFTAKPKSINGRRAGLRDGLPRRQFRGVRPMAPLSRSKASRSPSTGFRFCNGIDLVVHKGEAFGLVGESGSGKSVTWLARSACCRSGRAVRAGVRLDGDDILGAPDARSSGCAAAASRLIFQDPASALNPVLTIRPPDRGGAGAPRGLSGRAIGAEAQAAARPCRNP
jgi:hypothetical protein